MEISSVIQNKNSLTIITFPTKVNKIQLFIVLGTFRFFVSFFDRPLNIIV